MSKETRKLGPYWQRPVYRRRGHLGSRGVKIGYDSYQAAKRRARELMLDERVNVATYLCARCSRVHIGTIPWPRRPVYDTAQSVELGERAFGCLKMENYGSTEFRLRRFARFDDTLERIRKRNARR
jgi:hypothetical protein